eukprot:363630-Chlamydomonas_euryale.AAC.5
MPLPHPPPPPPPPQQQPPPPLPPPPPPQPTPPVSPVLRCDSTCELVPGHMDACGSRAAG